MGAVFSSKRATAKCSLAAQLNSSVVLKAALSMCSVRNALDAVPCIWRETFGMQKQC